MQASLWPRCVTPEGASWLPDWHSGPCWDNCMWVIRCVLRFFFFYLLERWFVTLVITKRPSALQYNCGKYILKHCLVPTYPLVCLKRTVSCQWSLYFGLVELVGSLFTQYAIHEMYHCMKHTTKSTHMHKYRHTHMHGTMQNTQLSTHAHIQTHTHTYADVRAHTHKTSLAFNACSLRQVIAYSIEHQLSSGEIQQCGSKSFLFCHHPVLNGLVLSRTIK